MSRSQIIGREERIRTSGPCVPNAVLYQAELLPDPFTCINARDAKGILYASLISGSSHRQNNLCNAIGVLSQPDSVEDMTRAV